MRLMGSEIVDGKWVPVALPADPAALDQWLLKRDGEEAVVMNEETKRYYCGSMKLVDGYRAKGHKADSFYPLAKQLWESAGSPLSSFQEQPHYCAGMGVLCSAKLPAHLGPTPCRSCTAAG